MERMIRITPSMNCSPATSSIHHQPDELATLLRSHYNTAFEILPKEMTKPVRMYYDFDGELPSATNPAEFELQMSLLNMYFADLQIDGMKPVVLTSHAFGYIKKGERINKVSYRLYYPKRTMSMADLKATLPEFAERVAALLAPNKVHVSVGKIKNPQDYQDGYLEVDAAVYSPERKMRLAYQSKDGEKRTLIPLITDDFDITDTFITLIPDDALPYAGFKLPEGGAGGAEIQTLITREAPKAKVPKSAPPPHAPQNEIIEVDAGPIDDEVAALCGLLSEDFLMSRDNWIRLLICLKTMGPQYKPLFLETSRRAKRYDKPAIIKENSTAWDSFAITSSRITIGSLKHWARKSNPKQYYEVKKKSYSELLNTFPLTSNELCEVFTIDMAGDILYSESLKSFYTFNQDNGLWDTRNVSSLFTRRIQSIAQKLIGDLPTADSEEQTEKNKKLTKVYLSAVQRCDGHSLGNIISKYLPAFCTEREDPVLFMNCQDDYLNLDNGVWCFSSNKMMNYDRNHYFTFKLAVRYDPHADASLMASAMDKWFKGETEVIEFMRYWLGYCLTGYNDRQELLFVWGESAANGKSTLFGELMGAILGVRGGGSLMSMLSTAAIKNKDSNNDGVYNLNGKRFAMISEPSKTNGKVRFDEQLMKLLSGDENVTAQAKYKGEITFRITSKIAFIFNELPEINFEDNGMERRVTVLEMNVSFKKHEDYEKADERLKEKRLVQPRDEGFIKALKANIPGVLKYLLEGAAEFMKDKAASRFRPVPATMKAVKDKAVATLDDLGLWLDDHLEADEGNSVRVSSLRKMWDVQRKNFGQGNPGFPTKLERKVRERGWGWEPGPERKARERITGVSLKKEEEDGEV